MEFLDGDEWSVDCVADKGQLWVGIQRRKFMATMAMEHCNGSPRQTETSYLCREACVDS